jgi:hypothetical protein
MPPRQLGVAVALVPLLLWESACTGGKPATGVGPGRAEPRPARSA